MDRLAWSALLLCIAAILHLLGPIETTLESLLIAAGLAGWVAFAQRSPSGPWQLLARWLPACAGFLCLTRVEEPAARLAIVALVALATKVPHHTAAAGCAAAVGAGHALAAILPGAWSIPVALSRIVSSAIGTIVRSPADAGPTASGLWLFLVWLGAAGACRGAGARLGAFRCLVALACVGVNAATLGLVQAPSALLAAHHEAVSTPHGLVIGLFARGPLLFLILCALLPRLPEPAPRHARRLRLAGAIGATLLGAIFATALAAPALVAAAAPGARRDGDIVLRGSDAFDMQVPAAGRYGISSAGMFGMLPKYLALDGHATRLVQPPLDPSSLAGAAVAVVILPTSRLDAAEKAAIYAFVERGGSLLVMGDHTNLLSTMAPINDLTGRYGLRIRFDSAFAAREQWAGCVSGAGAFSTAGVGTGASLEIRGGALPILTAPYAFSDAGDRSNAGQEAFSGDRRWEPGEQVGDLVLAAAARSGRGRVVLFGDTSTFQNIMLPWSYEYVAALFDDLARDGAARAGLTAAAALGAVAAVCAAALAGMAVSGRAAASAALAAALLVQATACGFMAQPPPVFRLEHADRSDRVALIDDAHKNRYTRHLWHDRSIGGLVVNLQRLGMVPIVSRHGYAHALPDRSLAVLIEPRAPLTVAEIARLREHRARGGTLLVAASGRAGAQLSTLLAPQGIRLLPLPLGPVPVRGDLDQESWARALAQPQFRDAWPIEGPAGMKSHYAAFDRDIVVDAPRAGASTGRLIVMGDADFLTDRVLENETAAWPGNVAFLARLLGGEEGT